MHSLNQKLAAELLSVTPRTLRDWSEKGLPRNPDGTYDGPAIVEWLVMHRNPEGLDWSHERARLAKAQADKTEIENEVRAGRLLETARVIRDVGDMLSTFRARILAVPGSLGQRFDPSVAPIVTSELRGLLHEALAELSEYTPSAPRSNGSHA